jgi:hypothetical protein
VSFVYLSSGARFGKSGAYDMGLARLDIPVNVLTWEISLPDRLDVRQFGGNALSADLIPAAVANTMLTDGLDSGYNANTWAQNDLEALQPGQVGGVIVDPQGAVIPNAQVTVTNTQTGASLSTQSDGNGNWVITNVPPGAVSVTIAAPGFTNTRTDLQVKPSEPARMGTTLQVGTVNELVTIQPGTVNAINGRQIQELALKTREAQLNTASQNVTNLQRRVAGILPVAIEVPRSGKSYRFVRPLVLEEETRVTFTYKSR